MRALTGLILAGAALVAVPSVAHAADTPMCPLPAPSTPYDTSFLTPLSPYLSGTANPVTGEVTYGVAYPAANSVLGGQLARFGIDWVRQGWTVILSPGPHDVTSARTAIRDYLAARVPAAAVDLLDSKLTLLATPYSFAELQPIAQALSSEPIVGTVQIDCQRSDALRVEVGIADAETPALRAQAEALTAPYGDKVRLRYGTGRGGSTTMVTTAPPLAAPPVPAPPAPAAKPAPRVRDHVALPATARCVRGGALKIKPGEDVQRLRLAAGSRKAFASNGKAARLKLKSKRTKVTVTATLKDGRTATQTLTYRRCA